MKCIILAAGYATRLYPLTENFPKPLLEVRGKTILDWLIDDIDGAGLVDEYFVVTNHKFAGHFQKWADGHEVKITVIDDGTSTNETRLGAVRDVKLAIDMTPGTDVLVIAGDNVLDFSLQTFISYARAKGTSCIMRYFEPETVRVRKSGVVITDGDDLILEMEEKPAEPKSHWVTPPFYFYTAADAGKVQEGIDAGCGVDAPGSYIAWLSTRVPVHAMEMPGRRYDIGSLESYNKVREEYPGIVK